MIWGIYNSETLLLCLGICERTCYWTWYEQLYQLGCDWTDNCHMFVHQSANILINLIDVFRNMTQLKLQVMYRFLCSTATIPTKMTSMCTSKTLCIFDMVIDEIIGVQYPQLFMLPIVSLKDEVEPGHITLINLLHDVT